MMKRHNRSSNGVIDRSDPNGNNDLESRVVENDEEFKYGLNPLKLMGIFVVCLMGLSVLFSFSLILKDSTSHSLWAVAEARPIDDFNPQLNTVTSLESDSSHLFEVSNDEVLGGLLPGGFDAKSCLSRHHSGSYRKESQYKPSSYLLSRLRSYESHLKRCGPYTMSYNKTVEKLKAGQQLNPSDSGCNYVVWISYSGLGNRILTLASAFLYALLTNRVLLVDRGADMADLFCEPFPETSWFLPLDFPITNQFNKFNQTSPHSYGNIVKNATLDESNTPFLYLHLAHDYGDHDKLFFCEQDQAAFQKIDWLIIKTDNYFIPSLFLIPSFEQELNSLFPEKETVFHFIGRYLLYPTNSIWGLITRFYEAYLAKADEKIGIQIRVFDTGVGPFQHVLDQILACTMKENLLPEVDVNNQIIIPSTNQKTKAVLMTSLSSGYLDKVRDIYWEHPTVTGEIIGVYQPSHEEYQQTEKKMQNKKAWAEMYLLSLTDKLVTSSWSTFGYVAQGLGGLKPWILYKPENATAPDPPCRRAMSMEPCFHAPPFYDCKKKTGIDTGAVVPHVRHCEDMSWGLKLVDHVNDL